MWVRCGLGRGRVGGGYLGGWVVAGGNVADECVEEIGLDVGCVLFWVLLEWC